MSDFDTENYWETRLGLEYSLHGVGRLNWGIYYNEWMYRLRRRVFVRWMRAVANSFDDADVLDVGSGTGFYVDRWRELGARTITGVDLTGVAVERLQAKYPDLMFHQTNIGGDIETLRNQQFDFISCMDVMFHIVDDGEYEKALANMYTLLKPGGVLVFSDLFLHSQTRRTSYVVHRTLRGIESIVDGVGFDRVLRRPMFVLMNQPVDSSNRLLRLYWGLLQRIVGRVSVAGWVLGGLLYPLELALVSTLKESPATEIMICRKPVSQSPVD